MESNMKKITEMYLVAEDPVKVLGGCASGLVVITEDVKKYKHNTTDVVQQFSEIE